jgi:RNA polymerase sigma-70 factor (ECF subfamily)
MSSRKDKRKAAEQAVHAACSAGDFDGATTAALNGFGGEIFGFLVDRLGSESDASEVFSEFVEDLWRGLPAFEWRSTLRVWAYVLARNAANRYARNPARRASRNVPLSQAPLVAETALHVRTRTSLYLRSEVKSAAQRLRQALAPDDQLLLSLRIDKGLSWPEIAEILEQDCNVDGRARSRAAARLRQRFQSLKARLRRQAQAAGLIDDDQPSS